MKDFLKITPILGNEDIDLIPDQFYKLLPLSKYDAVDHIIDPWQDSPWRIFLYDYLCSISWTFK